MTAERAPSDRPGEPVADPVDAAVADGEARVAVDPIVGQVLGERYRVIERLAEGGMGTVYRAEHVGLHKEVALKLVNEGADARPDHALRFMREALLTSRIDHPNIISATDYGTFGDGTAYLAMTLVTGPTLASVMKRERPMPWLRAAEIGSQICDAIAAAQAQGIVHRDLKPENLHLQPLPDGTEAVKVLDFGIAKYARDSMAPPAVRSAQQATRVGVVVGTPGYMAPEQAVGMRADHRADLYAIGVILWECVVGRKLWDFTDVQQLVASQLNQRPASVRTASGDLSIPDSLDALVASLLSARPHGRPNSAAEARDALLASIRAARESPVTGEVRVPSTDQFLDFASVAAGMAAEPDRSAPTVRYEPVPTPVVAPTPREVVVSEAAPPRAGSLHWLAVAGLVLAAALLLWWPTRGAPHAPGESALAGRATSPALEPQRTPVPAPTAQAVPPSAVVPAGPVPATSSPATAGAPAHAPQPATERRSSQPTAPRGPATARLRTAPAEPLEPLPDESADELRARARNAFAAGDFAAASRAYRAATRKQPQHAGGHAGLGASLFAVGDAKGAIAAYQRAITLSPGSSGFHAALGRAHLVAGDRTRAVAAYRRAVALDPNNQTAFSALEQLVD